MFGSPSSSDIGVVVTGASGRYLAPNVAFVCCKGCTSVRPREGRDTLEERGVYLRLDGADGVDPASPASPCSCG
jgi:hypothetical protein